MWLLRVQRWRVRLRTLRSYIFHPWGGWYPMSAGDCPRCLGDGWWNDKRCRKCGGTGRVGGRDDIARVRRLLWVILLELSGLLVILAGLLFGWWSV